MTIWWKQVKNVQKQGTLSGDVCVHPGLQCPDIVESVDAGDLPAEGGAEQRHGAPHAPRQRPWSRRHVHAGGAARSRHHVQPLSALPARQHLCKLSHEDHL